MGLTKFRQEFLELEMKGEPTLVSGLDGHT
jgi:hypothetical protein